ncbi:HD-GYP domain-containing protein [Dermacoccaceae bacterium W4C1]
MAVTPDETAEPPAAPESGPGGSAASRYVTGLCLALAMGGTLCAWWTWRDIDYAALLALLVLAVIAELPNSTQLGESTAVSVRAVVLAAALPACGPAGAALIGAVAVLASLPRGTALIVRAFNSAESGLIGLVGGLAYLGLGGAQTLGPSSQSRMLLERVLLPLLGASLVMLAVNALLLGGILWLTERRRLRLGMMFTVRQVWVIFLGSGFVSFLFVVLWQVEQLGPLSLLLVIAPLVLAMWYVRGAGEEREAQLRTVRTLAATLEIRGVKRPGQAGYASDVGQCIGEELALSPRDLDSLSFAAAVHNIGLIAPIKGSPGELDAPWAAALRVHPERGVQMLAGIDFLHDSRQAIRHHHERWDGRGYPDGLAGAQIPLLARILAVADAWSALVWENPHRPERDILEELDVRAGTHLDPRVVQALRRVVEQERLPQLPETGTGPVRLDHDHPRNQDWLLAQEQPR